MKKHCFTTNYNKFSFGGTWKQRCWILTLTFLFLFLSSFILTQPVLAQSKAVIKTATNSPAPTTYSNGKITFPIDPQWIPVEYKNGAFVSKDKKAAFSLNNITPLGSMTPEAAYEAIMTSNAKRGGILSQSPLVDFVTTDGVNCKVGTYEGLSDNLYFYAKIVIVPQKNLVISFNGQKLAKNTNLDVETDVNKIIQGLTFQIGDKNILKGNTFQALGGISQLCLKDNGVFYYYAMNNDHSQWYFTGTYEALYGQAAFDKLVSMSEFGISNRNLNSLLSVNMNGYTPAAISKNALILKENDPKPPYFVCKDNFYVLLLHSEKKYGEKSEVDDLKHTFVYYGYYIPELKLFDSFNTTNLDTAYFQLSGPSATMDVDPKKK